MRKMENDPDGVLFFYRMALLFLEKVDGQRHKLLARTAA